MGINLANVIRLKILEKRVSTSPHSADIAPRSAASFGRSKIIFGPPLAASPRTVLMGCGINLFPLRAGETRVFCASFFLTYSV